MKEDTNLFCPHCNSREYDIASKRYTNSSGLSHSALMRCNNCGVVFPEDWRRDERYSNYDGYLGK